jgi:rubrerythrin
MTVHDPDLPTLDELDADGALRDAADALPDRAGFFKRSGAFIGGGLLLGSLPIAFAGAAGTPKSDVKILNYALTLEYLESAFYAEAVSQGALDGSLKTFAGIVSQHEAAHVAALQKALGSAAAKKPKFDFKGTTRDRKKFAATAQVLEDTGVSAYEGQATAIKTPAVLMAAGSILPVEARHAAWIRDINGAGHSPVPAPDAFNPAKSMSAVLAAVKQTGFITG